MNYPSKLSLAVLNCHYDTPISMSRSWGPHLHCVLQMGSNECSVNGISTSGFLDDVICFAFPIIPRICSSQQRVSPAETTTPRSLSFSTTCQDELPIVQLLLGLSLPICKTLHFESLHYISFATCRPNGITSVSLT